MLYPHHDGVSQDYPGLSAKEKLAGSVSVTRVRPRTSKGITAVQKVRLRGFHRTIQSVGATGGVYKGQGRNQRELITRAY